jgi:hypothetical protein
MTVPVFFKAAEIKQTNVQEQERECTPGLKISRSPNAPVFPMLAGD